MNIYFCTDTFLIFQYFLQAGDPTKWLETGSSGGTSSAELPKLSPIDSRNSASANL